MDQNWHAMDVLLLTTLLAYRFIAAADTVTAHRDHRRIGVTQVTVLPTLQVIIQTSTYIPTRKKKVGIW